MKAPSTVSSLAVPALILSSACTAHALNLSKGGPNTAPGNDATSHGRRTFMQQVATSAGLTASGASMGWFANINLNDHHEGCTCGSCSGHGVGCACESCQGQASVCSCNNCVRYGPTAAMAYDRDVGGEGRSATTAAQNIMAKQTNARLQSEGFRLDTKEEEQAKISEAFASFSYDASTKGQKKFDQGKGYGSTQVKK
uniref:Uncharacterized protein n=1 Tax=Helicotheca tamesis TaxID=374047 RepID=A0A7S2MUJ7_9STRA|mmetsp:Transcript_3639/g.4922  ORF Transcript_3639/g.4922 Transcript_3639/m.4922 type:complete len:198 (+) Transcript_3639:118-711(+)